MPLCSCLCELMIVDAYRATPIPQVPHSSQGIYRLAPSSADRFTIERHQIPHHRSRRQVTSPGLKCLPNAWIQAFPLAASISATGVELPIPLFRQELDKAYECVLCRPLYLTEGIG